MSDSTLRKLLEYRASKMDLGIFLRSLSPAEYRELTFFWGSAVQFWRDSNQKHDEVINAKS